MNACKKKIPVLIIVVYLARTLDKKRSSMLQLHTAIVREINYCLR